MGLNAVQIPAAVRIYLKFSMKVKTKTLKMLLAAGRGTPTRWLLWTTAYLMMSYDDDDDDDDDMMMIDLRQRV